MADTDDGFGLILAVLVVQVFLQIGGNGTAGSGEIIAAQNPHIQQVHGVVQHAQNIGIGLGDGIGEFQNLHGNPQVVVSLLTVVIDQLQLSHESGGGAVHAGIGIQIQVKLFLAVQQAQFGMVDVHALGQDTVDVSDELGVAGIPLAFVTGTQGEADVAALPFSGNIDVTAEPGVAVGFLAPALILAEIPEIRAVFIGNGVVGLVTARAVTPVGQRQASLTQVLLQPFQNFLDAVHGKISCHRSIHPFV